MKNLLILLAVIAVPVVPAAVTALIAAKKRKVEQQNLTMDELICMRREAEARQRWVEKQKKQK